MDGEITLRIPSADLPKDSIDRRGIKMFFAVLREIGWIDEHDNPLKSFHISQETSESYIEWRAKLVD